VSWTLPPLQEADAALFQAFLVSLSGQAGRFYLYNAARPAPRGSINTSGVTVSGAVAAGASACALAGCGNTKTLLRGDHFAVAGELKMVVGADLTSDAAGAIASVAFAPAARAAWSISAAVTLLKPTATFMLDEDAVAWITRLGMFSEHVLAATEAFA